jgi:hypothetical protein
MDSQCKERGCTHQVNRKNQRATRQLNIIKEHMHQKFLTLSLTSQVQSSLGFLKAYSSNHKRAKNLKKITSTRYYHIPILHTAWLDNAMTFEKVILQNIIFMKIQNFAHLPKMLL